MQADLFLEDLKPGDVWEGEPFALTVHDIVAFGGEYDPQPFHTDPEAAKASPFGSLVASGWHVLAVAMRWFVEAKPYGSTPVIGLGVDDLRWLAPVRPGDMLSVRREVVEVTRSRSRPDRGTVRSRVTIANQDQVQVMHFDVLTRMPARHPGAVEA